MIQTLKLMGKRWLLCILVTNQMKTTLNLFLTKLESERNGAKIDLNNKKTTTTANAKDKSNNKKLVLL